MSKELYVKLKDVKKLFDFDEEELEEMDAADTFFDRYYQSLNKLNILPTVEVDVQDLKENELTIMRDK